MARLICRSNKKKSRRLKRSIKKGGQNTKKELNRTKTYRIFSNGKMPPDCKKGDCLTNTMECNITTHRVRKSGNNIFCEPKGNNNNNRPMSKISKKSKKSFF